MECITRMDCALEDSHKRDILYGGLKKSEALKIALQPYKLKPSAERTYAELMRLFKKWLQENKEDQN